MVCPAHPITPTALKLWVKMAGAMPSPHVYAGVDMAPITAVQARPLHQHNQRAIGWPAEYTPSGSMAINKITPNAVSARVPRLTSTTNEELTGGLSSRPGPVTRWNMSVAIIVASR